MATGLLALLDDVAAIAKVAAASLDDTVAAAGKASVKAAGVVIDDAAVTPQYVQGFTPARELPIVGKIALGSLKNKLVFLLPGAILLSWAAPWAINPILMVGGAYLCFEGAEKIYELFRPHAAAEDAPKAGSAAEVEKDMVQGAIRTDLILSGEIMAISLNSVADKPMAEQAVVLVVVGIGITALVYGAVAMIVKADDVGVALARSGTGAVRALGRGLVQGVPPFLSLLAKVGTAAMLWVGGGIFLHGLHLLGVAEPDHSIQHLAEQAGAAAGGFAQWLVGALGAGLFGLLLGGVIVAALHLVPRKH
ncbi:MAG: ABC transporter [Alphaproteobacteria bacterium PA4]|nr:MAG: ABC transporter [Alphaproteobacteria bacterium PA4]